MEKHQDTLFETSNGQSYKKLLSLCSGSSLNSQMFELLIKSPWQLITMFFYLTTAGK